MIEIINSRICIYLVIQQTTSQNDEIQTVRSESPVKITTNQNKQISDQIKTNLSVSKYNSTTSFLHLSQNAFSFIDKYIYDLS